jgi:ABC-2 type transport system ATP-binding protein
VVLTTHYIDEAEHLANRLIILAAGRIVADTTPAKLRIQGGPMTIRCEFDDHAVMKDLPPTLAPHLSHDSRSLVMQSDDITDALRDLLAWADRHQLQLDGLEVSPPSLEDAYLAAIGAPSDSEGDPL